MEALDAAKKPLRVFLYPAQVKRLGHEPFGSSVEHWIYNPETGEFEPMAKGGKD